MARGRRNAVNIYQRMAKRLPDPHPLPIVENGSKQSQDLHSRTEKVSTVKHSRIKLASDILKMSAALRGSYSLSANQVGLQQSMFVTHKDAPLGEWMHPKATEENRQQDEVLIKLRQLQRARQGRNYLEEQEEEIKEELSTLNYILDPEGFECYFNPTLLSETVTRDFQWEYCLSFPNISSMVSRPLGIDVQYVNEEGLELEQRLYDFQARMFLHEMDHLDGRTMTHWSMSEGNTEVLEGFEGENDNFITTTEFYKDKIELLKKNYAHLFEEHRKFEIVEDPSHPPTSGKHKWKKFESDKLTHSESYVDLSETNSAKYPSHLQAPTIEESMIIDCIRAMRRDKRLKERRNSRKNSQN